MSTRPLEEFRKSLQLQFLKPLGFKKERSAFTRQHNGWWERYTVRANTFNRADNESWLFYLDVEYWFDDLPPHKTGHIYGMVHQLILDAPVGFALTSTNATPLQKEIHTLIEMAHAAFLQNKSHFHAKAKAHGNHSVNLIMARP